MGDPVARTFTLPTSSGAFGPNPGNGFVDVSGIAGYETGGTNAVAAVIREGSATGKVIGVISCAAGAAAITSAFSHAVRSNGQLYCVIVGTGTIAGSVHIL